MKFQDDAIDETSILAQLLSSDSAISSMLDMSIRLLPGDHGLPLQQVFLCQPFSGEYISVAFTYGNVCLESLSAVPICPSLSKRQAI